MSKLTMKEIAEKIRKTDELQLSRRGWCLLADGLARVVLDKPDPPAGELGKALESAQKLLSPEQQKLKRERPKADEYIQSGAIILAEKFANNLLALHAAHVELKAAFKKLARDWDFAGDIDGATFQETMIECGILRAATNEEKRDCDPETCACRDYQGDSNYKDWDCWRISE